MTIRKTVPVQRIAVSPALEVHAVPKVLSSFSLKCRRELLPMPVALKITKKSAKKQKVLSRDILWFNPEGLSWLEPTAGHCYNLTFSLIFLLKPRR